MDKSLADIIDLRKVVKQVLQDYQEQDIRNERVRTEIADKIYIVYSNIVKDISTRFLQKEIEKRSTLSTFEAISKKP